ncbi:MAG TPA: hypothetical protein VMU13_00875 [Candidatus Paceibacterota bacterium]|nr:hypothetical protein [Candidatus Paceibacterota bacterium]
MIKRILLVLLILFFIAFIAMWILSGGFQNIKAAVNHYRNPLQYHSIIDYFFQIGSTTGETFKLPGTPSTYPTISMPSQTSNASTSYGPTTIYIPGSNGGTGGE